MNLIGIIPAAGQAKRLPFLPFSKELFPISYLWEGTDEQSELKLVHIIDCLISQMINAQIKKIFVIINKEKADIVRYLGNGKDFGCAFSYLIQEERRGMPDALNLAFPWVVNSTVVFGMPDTFFSPHNAFNLLLDYYNFSKVDVTLGLFPTDQPQKYGMVSLDRDNFLEYTIDKPASSDLKYMWGIACWGKAFSNFMNEYIKSSSATDEVVLSEVFQSAKNFGLKINGFPFVNGKYMDIGTPKDLINGSSFYQICNTTAQ